METAARCQFGPGLCHAALGSRLRPQLYGFRRKASAVQPQRRRQAVTTVNRDMVKENSRVFYRQTVYTHDNWAAHRSSNRYVRHLKGLIRSKTVQGLSGPLLLVVLEALGVASYEQLRELGKLPATWPTLTIPMGEVSVLSFALSLLLVFRTNSSYQRWDEARKIWGLMLNRSRDFMRQGTTWFPDSDSELLEVLERWMSAFPKTLKVHLRENEDLAAELQGILRQDELAQLIAADHRPNFVLQVLSEAVQAANLSDAQLMRMDSNLTSFADDVGGCERILKTPIPLSYTRHTSRFLVCWIAFLPFTLWTAKGWGMVPISAIWAFFLLGIEEIGVQIEEPFGILALEAISGTAERNIKEICATRREWRDVVRSRRQAATVNSTGNGERPVWIRDT